MGYHSGMKDASDLNSKPDLGGVFGFWVLRLWLAVRAVVTGIEKYSGSRSSSEAVTIDGAPNTYGLTASQSDKVYGLEHYHGVPETLAQRFADEPLIPGAMLSLFDKVLGPALIVLGLMLLVGLATRISLLGMGLVYVALTVGLILLKQDAGVAWLGVHVGLVALALNYVPHNRLAILKKW